MTHALERTSPTGQPFVGRCVKCGTEWLKPGDALKSCMVDALISDEEALLRVIKDAEKQL
jgi:hypothetical protein